MSDNTLDEYVKDIIKSNGNEILIKLILQCVFSDGAISEIVRPSVEGSTNE